jgi:hypothetical protein
VPNILNKEVFLDFDEIKRDFRKLGKFGVIVGVKR